MQARHMEEVSGLVSCMNGTENFLSGLQLLSYPYCQPYLVPYCVSLVDKVILSPPNHIIQLELPLKEDRHGPTDCGPAWGLCQAAKGSPVLMPHVGS